MSAEVSAEGQVRATGSTAGATCRFCGSSLKGHAEMTWEGGGSLIDECPRCGTYDLPLDLVPLVDGLEADARDEIQAYLEQLAAQPEATPMRFTKAFFGM